MSYEKKRKTRVALVRVTLPTTNCKYKLYDNYTLTYFVKIDAKCVFILIIRCVFVIVI